MRLRKESTPVQVISNYYRLHNASTKVFVYEVNILEHRGGREGEVGRRVTRREKFWRAFSQNPQVFGEDVAAVVFDDQRKLYTTRPLKLGATGRLDVHVGNQVSCSPTRQR